MQAVSGQRMYGRTLPEHMDGDRLPRAARQLRARHLADRTTTSSSSRDAGVTIVHNPVSNMKLGSGISPVPQLLRAGVNVALGTDGMSSNDGNDMYATLKIAGLLHKLWEIDYRGVARRAARRGRWRPSGGAGGGRGGRPRTDRAGTPCRPRAPRPRRPASSRRSTTRSTTSSSRSSRTAVDSTMVGGRWVVRDGRLTGVDETRSSPRRVSSASRALASRRGVRARATAPRASPPRLAASARADVGARRSMPV